MWIALCITLLLAGASFVTDKSSIFISVVPSAKAERADGRWDWSCKSGKAMRTKTYNQLRKAQTAAAQKDYSFAQEILDEMLVKHAKRALKCYGLANLYNLYGFLMYEQGDYAGALRYYKYVLDLPDPDVPDAMQLHIRFTVAQIYFVQEEWQNGIDELLLWLDRSEKSTSGAYALLAKAHYQLQHYSSALENIELALSISGENGVEPEKGWLILARHLDAMVGNRLQKLKPLIDEVHAAFNDYEGPPDDDYAELVDDYADLLELTMDPSAGGIVRGKYETQSAFDNRLNTSLTGDPKHYWAVTSVDFMINDQELVYFADKDLGGITFFNDHRTENRGTGSNAYGAICDIQTFTGSEWQFAFRNYAEKKRPTTYVPFSKRYLYESNVEIILVSLVSVDIDNPEVFYKSRLKEEATCNERGYDTTRYRIQADLVHSAYYDQNTGEQIGVFVNDGDERFFFRNHDQKLLYSQPLSEDMEFESRTP